MPSQPSGKSDFTPLKQAHLEDIFALHMRIVSGLISGRYSWVRPCYHYFDLNAGPGIDDDGDEGSPLIFLRRVAALGIPARAWFFERRSDRCLRLRSSLDSFCSRRPGLDVSCSVVKGNHVETLPQIAASFDDGDPRRPMGLLYSDPYGVPEFDAIRQFLGSPIFDRLDALIYLGGAGYKRPLYSDLSQISIPLDQQLLNLGKRKVHVRKKCGNNQWTFTFLTNFSLYPELMRDGFFDIETERGRGIFEEIVRTRKELEAMGHVEEDIKLQKRLFY